MIRAKNLLANGEGAFKKRSCFFVLALEFDGEAQRDIVGARNESRKTLNNHAQFARSGWSDPRVLSLLEVACR